MKNEFEEQRNFFKSGYPKMIQLEAKLDSMRDELKSEIRKAVDAAESEYQSALKTNLLLRTCWTNKKTML